MRTIAPCLLLLLAATAPAQSAPNLIALTLNTPLIHQSVHGTCTPLNQCTPLGLPLPTVLPFPFWAGGTAWDSTNSAVWATTGQMLGRYGMNGCSLQCAARSRARSRRRSPRPPGSTCTTA